MYRYHVGQMHQLLLCLATQRWAAIATEVDAAAGGERYTQITKLDLVHTLQYTDCKGNVKVVTNTASTVLTLDPQTLL